MPVENIILLSHLSSIKIRNQINAVMKQQTYDILLGETKENAIKKSLDSPSIVFD